MTIRIKNVELNPSDDWKEAVTESGTHLSWCKYVKGTGRWLFLGPDGDWMQESPGRMNEILAEMEAEVIKTNA